MQRLREDCHRENAGLPALAQWLVSTAYNAHNLQALHLDMVSLPEHLDVDLLRGLRVKHLSITARVSDHGDHHHYRFQGIVCWVRDSLVALQHSRTLESLALCLSYVGGDFDGSWPGRLNLEGMSRLKHAALDVQMPINEGISLPAGCCLMLDARSAEDRRHSIKIAQAISQAEADQERILPGQHTWPHDVFWVRHLTAIILTTNHDFGTAQAPLSLEGFGSPRMFALTTKGSAYLSVPQVRTESLAVHAGGTLSIAFGDAEAFMRGVSFFRFQGDSGQATSFAEGIRQACMAVSVSCFEHTVSRLSSDYRYTSRKLETVTLSSSKDALHESWDPVLSQRLWPRDPILNMQDMLIESLKS